MSSVGTPLPLADASGEVASASRRGGKLSVSLVVGGSLVILIIVAAIVSYVWTPYNPIQVNANGRFIDPSGSHWFGTDALGRDIFSNIIAGARVTLLVGIISVGVGAIIGIPLGIYSAISGHIGREVASRGIDLLLAFPALLLAVAFGSIWGASTETAMLAIGIATAPLFARLSRGGTLQIMTTEYVLAARVAGRSTIYIVVRHVLPNIAGLLIVQASVAYGVAVLAESGLAYLGFGTPPPTPSWGLMLQQAQTLLYAHPLLSLWPAAAIFLAVLGFNLLGDGLRDYFDPRLESGR